MANALAGTLMDMGYKLTLADPDVWLRPGTKASGFAFYVLVYVDDMLVISDNPQRTMKALADCYRLKEGSVGKPTSYLGAQVIEWRFPEDPTKVRWALSSEKICQRSNTKFRK